MAARAAAELHVGTTTMRDLFEGGSKRQPMRLLDGAVSERASVPMAKLRGSSSLTV